MVNTKSLTQKPRPLLILAGLVLLAAAFLVAAITLIYLSVQSQSRIPSESPPHVQSSPDFPESSPELTGQVLNGQRLIRLSVIDIWTQGRLIVFFYTEPLGSPPTLIGINRVDDVGKSNIIVDDVWEKRFFQAYVRTIKSDNSGQRVM